jgi:hypothetical protein
MAALLKVKVMALFDPKFYEHEQQETQAIAHYTAPRKNHTRYIVLSACAALLAALMVLA